MAEINNEQEQQIADQLLIDAPEEELDPAHQMEDLEEEQRGVRIAPPSDVDWLRHELDQEENDEMEGYSSPN
jgi:hypothetical protein